MAKKRIVAAVLGTGTIGLVEQDLPELRPGAVLLEVQASLVSPGTELGGWRQLAAQRANPNPNAKPRPFGYSNAGVVKAVGEGVTEFKPGDRIACIGGGYAMHTDVALVPHHLCVALPDNVTYAQGAYAMLVATGLQVIRRGEPQLGEFWAVVGLGVLGQVTSQLLQLAGSYVIGWDTIPFRTDLAAKWGIAGVAVPGAEDEVAKSQEFSRGYGLDGGVMAFGGDGTKALQGLRAALKLAPDGHHYGRIIVVGGVKFDYTFGLTNADIREASRTGAGYHDEAWEFGSDYPPVWVRWSTRANLELCMRLLSEGKLNVDVLTTHTIPLREVEAGISAIIDRPDDILGVVFTM